MKPEDDHEFYFAYGANMSAVYLQKFRRVFPIESKPATVQGYALTFNLKGLNFLEPGFANILESSDDKVEGVLHRVSKTDLARILKSEPDEYAIIDVTALTHGKSFSAKALIHINKTEQTYSPSKRYLNILVNAAKEHKLTDQYIERIKSTKCVYYPFLSEAFGSIIYWVVRLKSK